MAVNSLCTAFRRVVIRTKGNLTARISTQASRTLHNLVPVQLQTNYINLSKNRNGEHIKFVPRTLNIDFGLPVPDSSRGAILDLPLIKIPALDRTPSRLPVLGDLPALKKSVDLPAGEVIEKQAVRMIVIRRKKMKKHQRIKMRKRIKAMWTKLKIRRELKRERLFCAEQRARLIEALNFSAEKYVSERLELFTRKIIPKTYRGEILPQSVVERMLNERQLKRDRKRNKPRLSL